MRNLLIFACFATLLAAGRLLAEEELPKPLSFARYDPMLEHSPFAVATAATPVVVAPNFAKNLYIANAAHSPDGDLVTLASSTDRNFKEYLTTRKEVHGFSISNIEWSERVGATKVTISKNGQFATLAFNEALLSQPIRNQNVAPVSMAPPGNPSNFPVPMPNAGMPNAGMPNAVMPTPPPHVRGTIPRKPVEDPNANPVEQ